MRMIGGSFSWALARIQVRGATVRRRSWPAGVFVSMTPEGAVESGKLWSPSIRRLAAEAVGKQGAVRVAPSLTYWGGAREGVSMGWRPTSEDMFATDWEERE